MGSSSGSSRIWTHVQAARLELCDWLETCAADEWQASSLCEGWNVKDVVAHLTLSTRTSNRDFVLGMIRNLGNFERMEAKCARQRASNFSSDQLVAQLRDHAGSTKLTVGGSPTDTLLDIVVHGQDVARPLGRDLPVPLEWVIPALEHAISSRWYGARKRFSNVALHASDAEWSSGSGAKEIRGPAIDLLLVATGRSEGLNNLTGSGIESIRRSF